MLDKRKEANHLQLTMDIANLSNLLKTSEEAQEARGREQTQLQAPTNDNNTTVKGYIKNEDVEESKDIWSEDEIPTEDMLACVTDDKDTRKCPRYEFCYKQMVGTEDQFGLTVRMIV